MLAQLAKLSSVSLALRRGVMEKKAVIGVLGTLAGKAAMTAAKNPLLTLTGVAAGMGGHAEYKKNMSKFREAHGQQIPTPPGV